ncbi:hypothetical protein VB796_14715 [Arcicella sp. LKC2W]|uniref:hypothetical protein n=1 Tax=Arcicella sp. LKC2W TaxID=2984198 RepID=UPI002B20895F|nr:hypothetical protein [Arcicella sp. LKC2W]MEA5460305.1 hypothetical protein [Arcicella sp. LKC2W]
MNSEQELDFLEQQIPILAEMALQQAYWRTLSLGHKVMIAENGFLIEVSPDGSRTVVKEIAKRVKVTQRLFTIVK